MHDRLERDRAARTANAALESYDRAYIYTSQRSAAIHYMTFHFITLHDMTCKHAYIYARQLLHVRIIVCLTALYDSGPPLYDSGPPLYAIHSFVNLWLLYDRSTLTAVGRLISCIQILRGSQQTHAGAAPLHSQNDV